MASNPPDNRRPTTEDRNRRPTTEMKIATWNVNGIRARRGASRWTGSIASVPDVLCLQEIKATPEQVPVWLLDIPDYWSYWHGAGGYSGVALLRAAGPLSPRAPGVRGIRRSTSSSASSRSDLGIRPCRVGLRPERRQGLRREDAVPGSAARVRRASAAGGGARRCCAATSTWPATDMRRAPEGTQAARDWPDTGRKRDALLDGCWTRASSTSHRRAGARQRRDLFTWWAPWRNLRQRNIGWRIDYVLASEPLAQRAPRCTVYREVGTSDHAPVVVEIGE